ncbi:MAG: phage holin family protein, partial [Patescibacteria group bacterium]|nr:phage holin family protein [Patescibacteria group bacterium]
MRWILRQLIYHFAALLTTVYLIPGFSIGKSLENIGLATVTLALINVFVKPIVKILFLPSY